MCLELFLCLNYPRMCDTPTLGLYCTRTGRYAYIARAFLVPAQESTHTLQEPFVYPHRKVRILYITRAFLVPAQESSHKLQGTGCGDIGMLLTKPSIGVSYTGNAESGSSHKVVQEHSVRHSQIRNEEISQSSRELV